MPKRTVEIEIECLYEVEIDLPDEMDAEGLQADGDLVTAVITAIDWNNALDTPNWQVLSVRDEDGTRIGDRLDSQGYVVF